MASQLVKCSTPLCDSLVSPESKTCPRCRMRRQGAPPVRRPDKRGVRFQRGKPPRERV